MLHFPSMSPPSASGRRARVAWLCERNAVHCIASWRLLRRRQQAVFEGRDSMQPGDESQLCAPPYIHNALSQAGLQLKIVPGKRYGLFSTKAFAAGNHIMTEDAAACCVSRNSTKLNPARTNDKSAPIACGHCMCDDKPLLTCTSCGISSYCCKQHQAAHWPRHKLMCARFKKSLADAPKEGAWQQHFSTLAICAELHDCANGKVPPSSAPHPSHADVMFLCSARASPAASVLTSALLQAMGVDGPTSKRARAMLHNTRRPALTPPRLRISAASPSERFFGYVSYRFIAAPFAPTARPCP